MYASIDFTTKNELRRAIQAGQAVVAYSPTLGMAAVTGRTKIEGPWPLSNKHVGEPDVSTPIVGGREVFARKSSKEAQQVRKRALTAWSAMVDVKGGWIVAVH
jgi:hypothetical protein